MQICPTGVQIKWQIKILAPFKSSASEEEVNRADGSTLNYFKLSDETLLKALLPTVSAAVLLRDPVLVVAPDVDGGADQHHQHDEAAEEGEDGHALLLALWTDGGENFHPCLCCCANLFQPAGIIGCKAHINDQCSRNPQCSL